MNKSKYYQRFDIVSMLLSLFVVMIHSSYIAFYTCPDTLKESFNILYTKAIPGFAVPMFFILSGVKFFNGFTWDKMTSKILRRKNSLLVPYLSWNVISLLWSFIICTVPFISKFIKARTLFDSSFVSILQGVFWFKYIHPLWYLAVLMIFVLLTPIVYALIKNKYIGISAIIALFLLHALPINYPETHYPMFQIRTLIYSADFYLIGAFLGRFYYSQLCKEVSKTSAWLALAILLGVIIARYFTEDIIYMFIPLILLGSTCIWIMTGRLHFKDADWLHMSFFIYPAHTFVLPCVNKLIFLACPDSFAAAVINTVLGTIITYGVCIMIGIFVKNHFNKLWSIINGR